MLRKGLWEQTTSDSGREWTRDQDNVGDGSIRVERSQDLYVCFFDYEITITRKRLIGEIGKNS